MSEIERLVDMMRVMRADGGCPWDREQTHESLVQYLLEEAHELAEAIETGAADDELIEELGDVLFQVVFHAEIARAEGRFDFERIAGAVADKMRSRHPHVFGDAPADIDSVRANWEVLKAAEAGKRSRTAVDDGVPAALPALQRAQKVLGRLERRGVDVDVALAGAAAGAAASAAAGAAASAAAGAAAPAGAAAGAADVADAAARAAAGAAAGTDAGAPADTAAGAADVADAAAHAAADAAADSDAGAPAGAAVGAADVADAAARAAADARSEAEFGDALLALVQRARGQGWDAERALRDAVRRLAAG